MHSALYEGQIRHRRLSPVAHAFRYRAALTFLDLSELDEAFRGRWLWSARRPALAWLRRQDHLGDPAVPLDQAVRDLVEARTGRRPGGAVRLLTHLRTFGHVFNPVSFHWCHARSGELEAVVADVANTPWGERHAYVLDAREAAREGKLLSWRFGKAFHVSPFMPMEQEYLWRLGVPGPRLAVHMETRERGRKVFDATLSLVRREIGAASLAAALARAPLPTVKVVAAIYWNALRLRAKGAPFFAHPGHAPAPPPQEPTP